MHDLELVTTLFDIRAQRIFVIVLAFSAVVAAAVALSGYYDLTSSDSLIVYFAGLVRWTPFYWGQDRYGMLIPALLQWVRDPMIHVVAENGVHVVTTNVCFFLLARYLFPKSRWIEIGAISLFAFIALSSLDDIKPFLSPWQVYTPAIMFGLMSLMASRRHFLPALVLAAVAQYCNFSAAIFMGLLFTARAAERAGRVGLRPVWKLWMRDAVILALSAAIANWLRQPYSSPNTGYGMLPWMEAISGWINLLRDYYTTGSTLWLLLAPPVAGLIALPLVLMLKSEILTRQRATVRSFLVAQFVLWSYAMIAGASVFAKWMGFPKRYLIPSLMIWVVSWAGLVLNLAPVRLKWSQGSRVAAALVCTLLLVFIRFGTPSLSSVRHGLDKAFAKTYAQVDPACTHVAGDYYRVWNSVFYSMLKREGQPLWGITYRAQVIRDRWDLSRFNSPKVCYWRDNEAEARAVLKNFGIQGLQVASTTNHVVIMDLENQGLKTSMVSREH